MTIQEAFETYRSNLEITATEQKEAAKTHKMVREKLGKTELVIDWDFLGGSYRRNTKNRPLKDIDLFIVLNEKAYSGKDVSKDPKKLLQFVLDVVQKAWKDESVELQNCSIQLDLSSTDFGFDIVPAFAVGDEGVLRIADRKLGEWRRTNPEKHISLVSEANERSEMKLVPLIKMLKGWNRERNKSALRSFWIEAVAMLVFTGKIEAYPEAIARFFEAASEDKWGPCVEPAGVGPDISPVRSSSADSDDAVQARIQSAAQDASAALKIDDDDKAIATWYEVLGDPFPKPSKKLTESPTIIAVTDLGRRVENPARPWAT